MTSVGISRQCKAGKTTVHAGFQLFGCRQVSCTTPATYGNTLECALLSAGCHRTVYGKRSTDYVMIDTPTCFFVSFRGTEGLKDVVGTGEVTLWGAREGGPVGHQGNSIWWRHPDGHLKPFPWPIGRQYADVLLRVITTRMPCSALRHTGRHGAWAWVCARKRMV